MNVLNVAVSAGVNSLKGGGYLLGRLGSKPDFYGRHLVLITRLCQGRLFSLNAAHTARKEQKSISTDAFNKLRA